MIGWTLALGCTTGPATDPGPEPHELPGVTRPTVPPDPEPNPAPTPDPDPPAWVELATWDILQVVLAYGVGDVTGDGELDLVFRRGIAVGPLLRDLSEQDVLPLPHEAGILGDVDGDGHLDLWARGSRGPHLLYGPITDGLTVEEVDAEPGPALLDPDDVIVSCTGTDLDGDGSLVLICGTNDTWASGFGNPLVAWDLPSVRGGPFPLRFEVASCLPDDGTIDEYGWWPTVAGIEDVDADGVREVLATGRGIAPYCLGSYVASAGLSGAVDPGAVTATFRQVNGYFHPMGDLDGDGTVDYFVQRAAGKGWIEQLLFQGPIRLVGNEVEGTVIGSGLWYSFPYDLCGVVRADPDGDGRLEFTEAARSNGGCGSAGDPHRIAFYPNTVAGWTRDPPPVARSLRLPAGTVAAEVSQGLDLDGDGRDEILIRTTDGRTRVYGFR